MQHYQAQEKSNSTVLGKTDKAVTKCSVLDSEPFLYESLLSMMDLLRRPMFVTLLHLNTHARRIVGGYELVIATQPKSVKSCSRLLTQATIECCMLPQYPTRSHLSLMYKRFSVHHHTILLAAKAKFCFSKLTHRARRTMSLHSVPVLHATR